MAKRILVPLDQTPAAESVVPLVADTARGARATVRLLHVAPTPDNVVSDGQIVAYADQEAARLQAEAMDYLQTIELRLEGIPVECVIRFGDPVEEILDEVAAFGADLITMTAGHRHGLGRLFLGSTAQHVCRRTEVPVMVIQPGALVAV
ncbi:MAG: universal stress protein [Candidatus Rokubacteria bacterium]|nr:universal stress protein [Candidatus Rokubacteria bacterium]